MGVKERFKEFIAYKRLTQRRFQASIGVSSAYINSITDGIGADVLRKVSIEYPELNTDWLLTGEGEMLRPAAGHTATASGDSSVAAINSHVTTGGDTALLQERVKHLEEMLAEKERLIKVYEKMTEGRK